MPLRCAVAAVLLRSGWRLALPPTHVFRLATGLVSGLVNGVAAIGGIAVAVMMSAAPIAPAVMRGTLIVLFLFTDLYALAWAAWLPAPAGQPLLGAETLWLAVWLAPSMWAGIHVGQRGFAGVSADQFRRRVLELLMAIAALSVLRALWSLSTTPSLALD